MLSARMGRFLGRVSRVFPLLLQGVYVMLDLTNRVISTQGKSAFVVHKPNVCERQGVPGGRVRHFVFMTWKRNSRSGFLTAFSARRSGTEHRDTPAKPLRFFRLRERAAVTTNRVRAIVPFKPRGWKVAISKQSRPLGSTLRRFARPGGRALRATLHRLIPARTRTFWQRKYNITLLYHTFTQNATRL